MVIMNNNSASVCVAVNSLTPFSPPVFETIKFKCPNQFPDRGILQKMNHTDTATAGSSMTWIALGMLGSLPSASFMSSR